MAIMTLNLPLPVLNGPGAAVDVSAFGGPLTFECVGSFPGATIGIEVSTNGGVTFSPLFMFQGQNTRVVPVAAQWVRAVVAGRKTTVPFAVTIDVAGPGGTSEFAALPMPALNGAGLAVDTSGFARFVTAVCTGAFGGAVVSLQISENNIDWDTIAQFAGTGGVFSQAVSALWMRAFVSGRRATVPFGADLSAGATDIGGGGGVVSTSLFQYTVIGTEPDLANLVIPLPVARTSTNYGVVPAQGTFTDMHSLAVPDASKTLADFVLALSGAATAGDTFTFFVGDL